MQLKRSQEGALRKYVLGELDEPARLEIEEQVITAPGMFEALTLAEQALIDDYLDESLPDLERATFERQIMALEPLREKVQFARRLRAHATVTQASGHTMTRPLFHSAIGVVPSATHNGVPAAEAGSVRDPAAVLPLVSDTPWRRVVSWASHPAWAAALAATLVVFAGGSAWWAASRAGERGELERLRTQHEQDRREADQLRTTARHLLARLAAEQREPASLPGKAGVAAPGSSATTSPVGPRAAVAPPTFVLATGLLRSEGSMPRVAIPAGTPVVRLRLPVTGVASAECRAVLRDADGQERWTVSNLHARGNPAAITVTVAADLLPPGDYQLQLSRAGEQGERLATYAFRVPRR